MCSIPLTTVTMLVSCKLLLSRYPQGGAYGRMVEFEEKELLFFIRELVGHGESDQA